jgi:hypothetical protein
LRDGFIGIPESKAPGFDHLTAEICRRILSIAPIHVLQLFNRCLNEGCFPKKWKLAFVKVILKPGKTDYVNATSYRPIGLLPLLGKGLEKIIFDRLMWHLESMSALSPNQYRFRPGKSAEEALYNLTKLLRASLDRKKYYIVISLDIKGVFDNAWWPMLLKQLINRDCPRQIYCLIKNYLRDRAVEVSYLGGRARKTTNKGCIQGSVLGPLFWSLIIDPLLQTEIPADCHTQAYVDDRLRPG